MDGARNLRLTQKELVRRLGERWLDAPGVLAETDADEMPREWTPGAPITLPFERCVFGWRQVCVAVEVTGDDEDGNPVISALAFIDGHAAVGIYDIRLRENWFDGECMLGWAEESVAYATADGRETAQEGLGMMMSMVCGFIAQVNRKHVVEVVEDNRKPRRRGQPVRDGEQKFIKRHYVVLTGQQCRSRWSGAPGNAGRKVPHLRRAHLRTLPDGRRVRVASSIIHKDDFVWEEHGRAYKVIDFG